MRSETFAKILKICGGEKYESQSPIPRVSKDVKILFTDINEDALVSCKNNISSFIQSSGNAYSESLFEEPKIIDFLKDDAMSILRHQPEFHTRTITLSEPHVLSGGVLVSPDTYSTGTAFVLLNPPFGIRLAKKSSTSSMYSQIATQLVSMREELMSMRRDERPPPSGVESSSSAPESLLMGVCLCPDAKTWSTFITTLTASQFCCETTHFSLGGNDMRAVCFWDDATTSHHISRQENERARSNEANN
jgi:hypothetical protein